MQVVPLNRTAQLTTTGEAHPAEGIRTLGGPPAERSLASGAPAIASPPIRFYRPPPK
jgi:hypothetical protein